MPLTYVRTLIRDTPVFVSTSIDADGTTSTFRSDMWPLVPGTVAVFVDGLVPAAFTVNPDLGLVVIGGSKPAPGQTVLIEAQATLLSDTEINTLIAAETDDRYAAAQALDMIASSQALVLKKMKTLDLDTDGPALAKSLREHAKSLRDQVRQELLDASTQETFSIAEQINTPAAFREKIWKSWEQQSS